MASLRANCRSLTSELTSVVVRALWMVDWKDGAANMTRMATIEITITISTSVKPRARPDAATARHGRPAG